MKKMYFLLLTALAHSVHADQVQESFLKAGALYGQGHIKQALDLYQHSTALYPSLLYNRGLCHYALGAYPAALADFRRAQRQGNQELFAKASQAISFTQKKLDLPEDSALERLQLRVISFVPADGIKLFFLFLLASVVWLVMRRRFTGRVRYIFIFLLMTAGICCVAVHRLSKQQCGIVIPSSASLYAGPHKQFHKVGEVRAGQQVKVVQQDQSWYKVYFRGEQGWIEQADLELF